MQTRQAGNTDLYLSVLGLGTMTMGWSTDQATSFEIMDAALEAGLNFFDSADIYSKWIPGNVGGESEQMIGAWMKARGTRQQVIVATKARGEMWDGPDGEGLSRAHLMRAVEDSLRRLQTDVIDLYQTHWADADVPYEETMRTMDDLVQQGKVRYIGCSNHTPQQLRAALDASAEHGLVRYETLQPHYNLVHRKEFEAELMGLCQAENLGVVPYSPLAGGFLTGKYKRGESAPPGSRGHGNDRMAKYSTEAGFSVIETLSEVAQNHEATPAQTAIAWMIANPIVTSAIIGATSVQQLHDTVKGAEIRLTAEELAALNTVSEAMP